jgi:hypothetical protein
LAHCSGQKAQSVYRTGMAEASLMQASGLSVPYDFAIQMYYFSIKNSKGISGYICSVSWKSILAKPFAAFVMRRLYREQEEGVLRQQKIFRALISQGKKTAFGKDHNMDQVNSYDDFINNIPVRDYEGLKGYFDRIKNGEEDVLWPGKPQYLAKTSGTTSGAKYIPITRVSMPTHIAAARNALLAYIHSTGNTAFINGKMIFLQGSPVLEKIHGILVGRLSGLVYHHVPGYLLRNRLPSYNTNVIEDWDEKVEAIAKETLPENMTLISGIPPWVVMYFEKLMALSGKQQIKDIFPDFSLFVYGGVNYEPYRSKMEALIGKRIDSIETCPASEGFIAFQDSQESPGLLLNLNAGMFFEFIPTDTYFDEKPERLTLGQVELNRNYALIISSNAGLWGYSIGDTIKFVSLNPYRIVVTGRIKHFISAFGEHVIGEEVEFAMRKAAEIHAVQIAEFTVAPQVNPSDGGLPYHEWLVEFDLQPENIDAFALQLDQQLQEKNSYYRDLITGKVLRPLIITPLKKNAFNDCMRLRGKLGGQNKVPRLANDRSFADELIVFADR